MELECGVCYQNYNVGRRCPRELRCKHSFCECCLKLLAQSAARVTDVTESGDGPPEITILCPMCRYSTILLGVEVRGQLPVDEDQFERLLSSGNFEDSESDVDGDPDELEDAVSKCEVGREDTSGTEAMARSRRRGLWGSFKRFCGNVIGDKAIRDRRGG